MSTHPVILQELNHGRSYILNSVKNFLRGWAKDVFDNGAWPVVSDSERPWLGDTAPTPAPDTGAPLPEAKQA